MIIKGANLGTLEVEYMPLSERLFFNDARRQQILKKLEKLYFDFWMESKKTYVQPFPQKNGKVEILPGMINHGCSNSLESLQAISQYGILASEWFGELESEREGVFCTFVDRIHSEENYMDDRASLLNLRRLHVRDNRIILFLDSENPIMKKLIHLDYFEYEKVKQQTPDKICEIYTSDEIELFEQLIEPFSPGGKDYHLKGILPYCDWSAIPGGIPPTLVNGICTKTKTYDKNYLDEISRLFPNATIFNGELEVIYIPKQRIPESEQETVALLNMIEEESLNQERRTTGGRKK